MKLKPIIIGLILAISLIVTACNDAPQAKPSCPKCKRLERGGKTYIQQPDGTLIEVKG